MSLIIRNFFAIQNEQPMTFFPTTTRNLLLWLSSTGVVRIVLSVTCGKLPFCFLLCGEFLKTYYLSMPQLWKYVPIRPNERFRKVLQS